MSNIAAIQYLYAEPRFEKERAGLLSDIREPISKKEFLFGERDPWFSAIHELVNGGKKKQK